jgi:hypothetical protein
MSGRRALWLVCAAGALCCAFGLWRVIAALWLRLPLDPNEGWNAYHAAAALSGLPLYPGGFLINNYPPLSFYLVGVLGRVLGDDIVAGRLVALIAFATVCGVIYVLARRLGARPLEAAAGALLFAGALLASTDYVGMDDPQMLAEAIAGLGLLLLQGAPQRTWRAAALFALAFFVKQNVVAMALAGTFWLALQDRRAALRLAAFGLLFLVAGVALFRFVYGTSLIAQLASARLYSWTDLLQRLSLWLSWSFVPLLGLAALALGRRRDAEVRFCASYAAIAIVLGGLFLGGAGVDQNAMFDADIALALGAALLLDRVARGWRAAAFAIACIVPLLLAAKAQADDDWNTADYWLHPMQDDAALAATDIAFLKAHPGPALCEMLSFCYWAGKPATVDVFNTSQAFRTGRANDKPLRRLIGARRFSVIQLNPDSGSPLGAAIAAEMARSYRLDHQDDFGRFYVPR